MTSSEGTVGPKEDLLSSLCGSSSVELLAGQAILTETVAGVQRGRS